MKTTVLNALLLLVTLHSASGEFRCDCSKTKCVEPQRCSVGVVPDMCNCCKVCAKDEGELCAGFKNKEGQCGNGLQCMVRQLRNSRNRKKRRVEDLVGRCEQMKCHLKRCPYGQTCRVVEDKATCVCPSCKEMIDKPVCGEKNNKQYKNECELKRDECILQQEIGLIKGPCQERNSTQLTCQEDTMKIEILKTYLKHQRGSFSLMDSNCKFSENDTHIFLTTKLNECGTKSTYTLTSVVYSNVVRTYTNPNAIIIRHKSIQLPFECEYSLQSRNSISIKTNGEFGDRMEERLRGNGVGIRIREIPRRHYRSLDNGLQIDINPLERYFVELRSKSLAKLQDAVIYPSVCYVTPVLKSQRWMKFILIEDGCPTGDGVEILSSYNGIVRLSVPGIKFRGARYPDVLVKCKLRACRLKKNQLDSSECKKTCNNKLRTKRSVDTDEKAINSLQLDGMPIMI